LTNKLYYPYSSAFVILGVAQFSYISRAHTYMPRAKMHDRVPHISHQPSVNKKKIYKITEIQRRHIMLNVKSN